MSLIAAREAARRHGTPLVMIDLDIVEANIARVQALVVAAGLANRPHVKTHKSPLIARMQVAAGARGLACQTLREAEVMADAGLDDLLIATNLQGEHKLGRLARLAARAHVTAVADSAATVAGLAEAGRAAGRPLAVMVECDTGRRRAGVASPGEAVALARAIHASPHLTFAGLMLYPTEDGWDAARAFVEVAHAGLRDAGAPPGAVSTGGTPNLPSLGHMPGATEHRPGTYVFNDLMQVAAGVAGLDDLALHVVATVASRAAPGRGVLDAGSKALSSDRGGLEGHGLLREHPGAVIHQLAEEHGFLDLAAVPGPGPAVGEVVRVVPNHACVVVNLAERLIAVRGDAVVVEVAVEARGW